MGHNTGQLVYRIPDLARLLGCSELAARRMVERGLIPSRRLGRRVIVLSEELEAHLRSLCQPQQNPERSSTGHSAQKRGPR